MRLTARITGLAMPAQTFQSFSVCTSGPATADTIMSAASATLMPCTASVVKIE